MDLHSFLCVGLADLYHFIRHILSYKMVTQWHSFLIQWAPITILIEYHAHVVDKYRWWLADLHAYRLEVIFQHDCLLYNLFKWCELGSKVRCLHWCLSLWLPGCWRLTHHVNKPCYWPSCYLIMSMVSIYKKCSCLIHQIEVLGICHQYLLGNMSTDFQNPSSFPLSHTQYLWSGVEDWYNALALDVSSDTQTPSLLTPGVLN